METVSRILLWTVVMLTGIEIGAALYESRVLVPLWASAPPGTVRAYDAVVSAYPSYAPAPGPQFWAYTTPALGIFSLTLFVAALLGQASSRFLILTSSGMILTLVLSVYLFFNPTLSALRNPELPYEETTRMVQLWVSLNWVRIACLLGAWFISLNALSPGQLRSAGK